MQLVCSDDMENVLHADDIISAPTVTGNYPSIRGELQLINAMIRLVTTGVACLGRADNHAHAYGGLEHCLPALLHQQ